MASVARVILPHYANTRRWREEVDWYRRVPCSVRLFSVSDAGIVTHNPDAYDSSGRLMRLRLVLEGAVVRSQITQPTAAAGTYTITLHAGDRGAEPKKVRVEVLPQWARLARDDDLLDWIATAKPRTREPITIPWSDLGAIADRLEKVSLRGWRARFQNMAYDNLQGGGDLVVDGFSHVIGMVGAGKSTLITLVLVWLTEHGKRATLIASNTSAVMQRVEELSDLGLVAVPVLGRTTAERQQNRYEKLFGTMTAPVVTARPWVKYLVPPCPLLAGSRAADIDVAEQLDQVPVGEYPCFTLSAEGRTFACPFLNSCPRFDLERDLPKATVWVTNLEAFIWRHFQSRQRELLFSEMVARESDVLILDEIDDLQRRIDGTFVAQGALDSVTRAEVSLSSLAMKQGMENMAIRENFRRLYRSLTEASQNFNALVASLKRAFWNNGRGRTSSFDFTAWGEFGSARHLIADDETALAQEMEEGFFEYLRQPSPLAVNRLGEPSDRLRQLWQLAEAVAQDSADPLAQVLGWIDSWGSDKSERSRRQAANHLAIALSAARLERLLEDITRMLPAAWRDLDVDGDPAQPLPRVPQGYEGLLPEVAIGSLMQFQYQPASEEQDGGRLRIVQYAANGRTLLLWFPWLWQAIEGVLGAHVLALSGTSWAPLATPNHVQQKPAGVLRSQAAMPKVHLARYIPDEARSLRVSGAGDKAEENLRRLASHLVKQGHDGKCEIERELTHLSSIEGFANRARVALLVHSYEQTETVYNVIQRLDGVRRLVRDDDVGSAVGTVRRSDLEDIVHDADLRVLVAPTTAFGRAHNVVGSDGKSIFGSAYLLVRPMSVPGEPEDIATALNHFALNYIAQPSDLPLSELQRQLRQRAWMLYRNLRRDHYGGYANLPKEQQKEIHWRLVAEHVQIIGRFIRGGGDAHVYLCDQAYASTSPTLRGMLEVLQEELRSSDPLRAEIAGALYGWLYAGLLEVEGQTWETADSND